MGRIGRDPEARDTQWGAVVSTAVAFDHGYGERKTTTWVKVSAWGKTGELLARLTKGCRVSVSGETYTTNWTTKDGEERQSLEMKISTITVIDWPDSARDPAPAPAPKGKPAPAVKRPEFDDGLPF
jgi:single-strand DNA-binding protein|tara:strand:+ start:1122 stop:1499 length:378 start_codon:yes stop_codon:yes gene_type:complete